MQALLPQWAVGNGSKRTNEWGGAQNPFIRWQIRCLVFHQNNPVTVTSFGVGRRG
jgi:hypothetical protein